MVAGHDQLDLVGQVGVAQMRHAPEFVLELQQRIAAQGGQLFDGDNSPGLPMPRAPHDPHRARTEKVEQFVALGKRRYIAQRCRLVPVARLPVDAALDRRKILGPVDGRLPGHLSSGGCLQGLLVQAPAGRQLNGIRQVVDGPEQQELALGSGAQQVIDAAVCAEHPLQAGHFMGPLVEPVEKAFGHRGLAQQQVEGAPADIVHRRRIELHTPLPERRLQLSGIRGIDPVVHQQHAASPRRGYSTRTSTNSPPGF